MGVHWGRWNCLPETFAPWDNGRRIGLQPSPLYTGRAPQPVPPSYHRHHADNAVGLPFHQRAHKIGILAGWKVAQDWGRMEDGGGHKWTSDNTDTSWSLFPWGKPWMIRIIWSYRDNTVALSRGERKWSQAIESEIQDISKILSFVANLAEKRRHFLSESYKGANWQRYVVCFW